MAMIHLNCPLSIINYQFIMEYYKSIRCFFCASEKYVSEHTKKLYFFVGKRQKVLAKCAKLRYNNEAIL
jgi:hypothetical protein